MLENMIHILVATYACLKMVGLSGARCIVAAVATDWVIGDKVIRIFLRLTITTRYDLHVFFLQYGPTVCCYGGFGSLFGRDCLQGISHDFIDKVVYILF